MTVKKVLLYEQLNDEERKYGALQKTIGELSAEKDACRCRIFKIIDKLSGKDQPGIFKCDSGMNLGRVMAKTTRCNEDKLEKSIDRKVWLDITDVVRMVNEDKFQAAVVNGTIPKSILESVMETKFTPRILYNKVKENGK
jgi:hypothetical protein